MGNLAATCEGKRKVNGGVDRQKPAWRLKATGEGQVRFTLLHHPRRGKVTNSKNPGEDLPQVPLGARKDSLGTHNGKEKPGYLTKAKERTPHRPGGDFRVSPGGRDNRGPSLSTKNKMMFLQTQF